MSLALYPSLAARPRVPGLAAEASFFRCVLLAAGFGVPPVPA